MADTWYAIVNSDGTLISVGTVIADSETLAAKGYTSKVLAGDPAGQTWNSTTQTFSPAPVVVTITTWQFIQLFTPAEYAAIESSNDPQVRQFLTMLLTAQSITMTNPVIVGGLQYLVSLNLLTSDRAAVIGAG